VERLLSSHEFPAFDVLTGRKEPYLGFGEILRNCAQAEREFNEAAASVQIQIQNTFDVKLDDARKIPEELDAIARSMWDSGWDPQIGKIDLFIRDFGLTLAEAIIELLGGRLVLRSVKSVSHFLD
jgi:hypothetical protein